MAKTIAEREAALQDLYAEAEALNIDSHALLRVFRMLRAAYAKGKLARA